MRTATSRSAATTPALLLGGASGVEILRFPCEQLTVTNRSSAELSHSLKVSDRRRNMTKSGQNRSESLCAGLWVPCRVFWVWFGVRRVPHSAELKGPRKLLRIRPGIFDFEPDLGLKLGQTKPKISGTVPTNRHTTIPNDSGPISACFDDDPKLLNCEIARPRLCGRSR